MELVLVIFGSVYVSDERWLDNWRSKYVDQIGVEEYTDTPVQELVR
jgi:hypothetical protein